MISVIMSTHNRGKKISRSIESILHQTYKNFEFIICDDYSYDNTYEILESFAKKDKRIVLLKNNKNLGLQKSLNRCLKISKGDFIARMDDDDYSKKDRFEVELSYLRDNPDVSFVGSNIDFYSKDKGIYGAKIYPEFPSKKELIKECQFSHPSILIYSSIIKGVNGYSEDEKYYRVEDYELWLRLYSLGYIGMNIQKKLLIYTKDFQSIKNIKLVDRINCYKLIKEYVSKFNFGFIYYIFSLKILLKLFIPCFIRKYINYFKYNK
ncbi:glycosyltransferase [Apilactobacillus timberlakei]|uniref:glycosyltransferase n=1 Tax=Apilactobacillus timberlakei TaxID=2008380 RepID=UPI00112738DF|nr:glycosyltransferase [Apilactobacillus timberlakei]TPR18892.1 glycosyltransferase [Apilactobacillus timberlakei]TPR20944.1 glycosyltransferase [Apilactobacillus timberlakei]TPR23595.1 glycosyltransferase [Apilactobacillus timberlakei]